MTPQRLEEIKQRSGLVSPFEANIGFCGLGQEEAQARDSDALRTHLR